MNKENIRRKSLNRANPLNECSVDMPTRIEAAENRSDALQLLLSESRSCSLLSQNVKFDEAAKAVPAFDSPFSIMHTHNLQLTDLIPHHFVSTDDPSFEVRDSFRPSVRLLAKIGKIYVFSK